MRDSHTRPGDGTDADDDLEIRQATLEDQDAVVELTSDIWTDRGGDYLQYVYPDWLEDPDEDHKRTFLVDANRSDAGGDDVAVAGLVQAVMLSSDEAWFQGLRIHGDYRRRGLSQRLNRACFDWARERGATVGRLMIFSWNAPALGASRSAGYEPATEFRWAHPAPDSDVSGPDPVSTADNAARAWRYWNQSAARDHLRGLALDPDESWALRELIRADLERFAADEGVFTVDRPSGVAGVSYRNRTYDRETEAGETEHWVEYGVSAWDDEDAARSLFAAIARDAARLEADRTRVLIPETVGAVSDASFAGAPISDEPDFVLEIDLSGSHGQLE
ncbi:GNAT family N-acetyltransferase [Natronosalvus caseinilyticus]|uniref:GNAT family N-acetyltransferase n=1 Tax=Natronosalvus caseinilyticus TaxID=2953747 RepID=UPI0028A8C3B8|nr:GNAT family N-acetyltransferase [Natronosalvus caseinilyticus]